MAYDVEVKRFVVPTQIDLSASAGDVYTWIMPTGKAIHVKGFSFIPSAEAVGDASTAAVVTLDWTATGESRAEKCTITLDSIAIGVETAATALTSATEFDVVAGETLIVEHKTQASGGTTTGAGYAVIYYTEINK